MKGTWLITGAGGQLGSVIMRETARRGRDAVGLVSPTGPQPAAGEVVRVDLADAGALAAAVRHARPAFIIHTAAMTSVQAAFEQPLRARLINTTATGRLAELAAELGARLLYTSTDLVFDGCDAPYGEDSTPAPLSLYGRTKLDAEAPVRTSARGLVVRLPLMYGLPAVGRRTTFTDQLDAIVGGRSLRLFEDEFRSPIWLEDAAWALVRAAESDVTGLIHAAGPQRLSRLEMGRIAAAALGRPDAQLVAIRQSEMKFSEPRPADVSLKSERYSWQFGEPPGRPMSDAMKVIADSLRAGAR